MKPKITGYRELTQAELALINRVKAKAKEVGELLDELEAYHAECNRECVQGIDLRWFHIGKNDLQKGFMAVIRAIARPEGF